MIKQYTHKLAPEIEILPNSNNNEIFGYLLEYINDCKNELNNRYIDTTYFEKLGPCIDWSKFIEDNA